MTLSSGTRKRLYQLRWVFAEKGVIKKLESLDRNLRRYSCEPEVGSAELIS